MTRPQTASPNPLLKDWTAPFGLPPFGAVQPGQFRPAFDAALAAHLAEIEAIAADKAAPSFDNTVAALERSGRALDRVANVFFVLAGADTGDAIEAVEREMSPLLARHSNALYLNAKLYARIADLYRRRDALGLSPEQARVLERYHTRFVRAGAALEKPAQDRLAAINERLASLGTQFGQNVLADEKAYALMLEEGDLAGLPDFARAAARAAADERGHAGQIRHHAGALVLRDFPAILFTTGFARENLPGLDQARRKWRRDRQPRAHCRDGGLARRARQAFGLCELRRLPARRSDGQDAGGRAQAAR